MSLRALRLLEFILQNATNGTFNSALSSTQTMDVKPALVGPTQISGNNTMIDDDDDDDDDTDYELIVTRFLALIIIGGLLFLAFLAYLTYKNRYQALIDKGIELEGQKLTGGEITRFKQWIFNPDEWKVDEVGTRLDNTPDWRYILLDYKQTGGQIKTISGNMPLQKFHDNCYFEVEIQAIDQDVDIVLGLCTKDANHPDNLPGSVFNSVGFHSKGHLTVNGQTVRDFKFNAGFGESIGLGYNFETHAIFLFYNGKFLNEPPRSPSPTKANLNKSTSPQLSKNPSANVKEIASSPTTKVSMFDYDIRIHEEIYYPIIGTTGKCTLQLNIGGAPFRAKQKAICKGLL